MKRTTLGMLSLTLLLAAGMGLSSCSQLSGRQGDSGEVAAPTSADKITFVFAAPRGLPTTYGMIHDEPEWRIKDNKLSLYEFTASDNKFVKEHTVELEGRGPQYKAELTAAEFVGPKNTIHPGENRRFLFVANNTLTKTPTPGVTTLDEVMKMAMSGAQGVNQPCTDILLDKKYLPMTGMARTGNGTTSENTIIPISNGTSVTVDLIRAVARIDIRTTMHKTLFSPNLQRLVIKDAVLNRVCDNTSVGVEKLPVYAVVSGVKPYATIPSEGVRPDKALTTNGIPGMLSKAFYLHETVKASSKDDVPFLDITVLYGDNNPKQYHVKVPFVKDGQPIKVKRNYIYTVVLGRDDLLEQGVSFGILVNDWEEQIPIAHPLELVAPTTTVANYDATTHTLSVPANGSTSAIEIPFKSGFQQSSATATVVAEVKGNPDWLKVTTSGNKVIISDVKPNYTRVERTAVVKVGDRLVGTSVYNYQFRIVQPKQ